MNLNDTKDRTRLSVSTLSALSFIKVNGPSPSVFSATPYVESWLKDGRHSSTDPSTGKSTKKGSTSGMTSVFM